MLTPVINKIAVFLIICTVSIIYKDVNPKEHKKNNPAIQVPALRIDYDYYLKSHSFAGEKMPLNNYENRKKYKQALSLYTRNIKSLRKLKSKAEYWLPVFEKIISNHNLPDDFKYIPLIESNLRQVKSDKGAAGFWQIIQPTGTELGLEINKYIDERYDPVKSAHAACRFFKKSYSILGNWTDVAVSYNMGISGLYKQLHQQEGKWFYDLTFQDKEISTYIFRLMAIKEIFENPETYNLESLKDRKMHYKIVKIDSSIHNLNKFLIEHKVSYKTFREYNGWIKTNRFILDSLAQDQYFIKMPYQDYRFDYKLATHKKEETDTTSRPVNQPKRNIEI